MERILLLLMILGYLILQIVWFLMDKRPAKEKLNFYILYKKNLQTGLLSLGLAIFIAIKLIYPNSWLSFNINSIQMEILFYLIGSVLYSFGLILSIWARVVMRDSWTPAQERTLSHKKSLVISGPFRYTRNPIYLGLIMIHTGFLITMNSYLIIVVPFIIWFLYQKDFGTDYLKYKSRVPKIV